MLDAQSAITKVTVGLLATLFGFVFLRYRAGVIQRGQLTIVVAAAAFCVSSLIFAFYAFHTLAWMAQNGVVNKSFPRLAWQTYGQFVTLLLAAALFGVFAYRELRQ